MPEKSLQVLKPDPHSHPEAPAEAKLPLAYLEHSRLRSAELDALLHWEKDCSLSLFGTGAGEKLYSPRQSTSIESLHPKSDGDGHSSGILCTCLPAESARQEFWEPEPHPVYQSINGSQYPQRYFHIGNSASLDVKLSPGMPTAAPGTGGWSGLHWRPWDGSICSLW